MFEGVKRLKRLGFVAAFAFAASSALAQGQANPVCGMPVMLDDGWTVASPESVDLDGTRLCGIEQRLKFTDSDVHAVVIVRHGRLVFEQYFSGLDQPWGKPEAPYDYDATTKHDMRSASKSIVSLLVGLAIDRRLIASVNEPLVKFFPELSAVKSTGWDKVTLRHLLTMSSGIKWDETLAWTDPQNDEPHLGYEADPVRYVLSKPIAAAPDTVWVYNGGGTDLLGNILERVSGKSLEAFAREFLFQPLDATDFEWKSYPKNGRVAAAAGLRLRPRDAAKIGQLILSDGAWNGRQVVPPDWIMQSVIPRFQATGYFGGILFYGYQWWMGRSLAEGKEVKWIAAMGWGGQRIFVIPDLDMVVMTTSGLFRRPKEGMAALDILSNSVIPSVRDKQ
jgi:CubicO group peptidase (beta-lactamase class C family)